MSEEHSDHLEHQTVETVGHDEGVFDIITDPAHMMAEGLSEGLFLLVGSLLTWLQLKRRDRRHGHAHAAH